MHSFRGEVKEQKLALFPFRRQSITLILGDADFTTVPGKM